ncbi:peptidase S8/S53 domain-containing protein, partial [Dactylonectria estremocensis]
FDSELFHGASFDLSAADNQTVASIQALDEVEKIWQAAYMTTPTDGSATVLSTVGTKYTAWSPHNDTKVAKMHSLGYYGEDVVIAFVDSGIDYTHEAFGGGFGSGFRVDKGYDLVGDNYVAGDAYAPDDDPMDCLGHGTHVAGIAASGDDYLPGVAPKARIRSYKVFGCGDGTYEDVIVAAFLQAYEEGADIISASLGSDRGFADTPTAEVATAIQAKGALVVIAAGNSGEMGPFYSSSGGNGFESTTVGSVQAADWVAYNVTATSSSGESRDIMYLSNSLLQFTLDGTAPASVQEGARDLDACNWDLESVPSDAVMIIPRGTCYWQVQDSTLIGKATNVFYVQTEGLDWEYIDRATYCNSIAALILYPDGDWIFTQAESGYDVTFAFTHDDEAISIPRESFIDGRINDFSSWGPTLDGRMKPEISAPGGSILSTWLVADGGWAVYSGTSMATPYISGVGALFFGSRGGRAALGDGGAKLAHERMIASGKPVHHNDGTDNLASVAKQGAGLVDAEKVLLYSTSISPANLNLNDTVNFKATHQVQVTNSGDEAITYMLTHEAGSTAHTKGNGDAWVSFEPPYSDGTGNVAEVSFSSESFTVGAGETKTLTLTFTEPETISASMLPVYGGSVVLAGDNSEVVRITYMGIKGSIYASDIWEMERGVPLFMSGYGDVIEEGHEYTFEEGTPVPQPYFNILWSTWEFSFDYVHKDWQPSDWAYPPVAGQNNWIGSFRLIENPLSGVVVDFPQQQYPRWPNGVYATPQAFFANGSRIESGDYRILGRALRTGGDASNIEDWQYKTSDWFRI